MDNFVWFIAGIIVLIVVLSLLWKAGWMAIGLAPMSPTFRTVLYILALVALAVIIWHYFGHLVRLP